MKRQPLTDPAASSPLGRTKSQVLGMLCASETPQSAHDIADSTGLHTNTARFHLDSLVETGLATRHSEDADTLGRPRMLYQAVSGAPPASRTSYRLLAEMLTSMVIAGMDRPDEAALAAGREWGSYLVERPRPSQRVDIPDVLRRIADMLTEAGFGTKSVPAEDGNTVLAIHHCPFRDLAEQHRDVVCSLHRGLMEGATEQMRAPVTSQLEPFAEPSRCLARLSPSRNAETES